MINNIIHIEVERLIDRCDQQKLHKTCQMQDGILRKGQKRQLPEAKEPYGDIFIETRRNTFESK